MDDKFLRNKPRKGTWSRVFQDYRTAIISIATLAVVVIFLWHLVSDGDFSFLMTLSVLARLFAMVLLVVKAHTENVTEISLKALQCYTVVSALRLCSILFYEGYLPFDSSGDWFYQAVEILSMVTAGYCAFLIMFTTKGRMYSPVQDEFGNSVAFGTVRMPSSLGALVLIVPSIIAGVLFHPTLNGNFVTDAAWSSALYLETVAVWPQDTMFKRGRRLHELTSLSVFVLGVSGVANLVFWLSSFQELNSSYSEHFGHAYPGYVVVICQFINLAIMFDFLRRYIKAVADGRPPELPI